MVQGGLSDKGSLIKALQGANVVYGVTDFDATLSNPASKQHVKPDQTLNQYSVGVEVEQGKNFADAVATIVDSSLELYTWSSLSNAKKWSNNKYTWIYHFDCKAVVADYIHEKHHDLANKTSISEVGKYAPSAKEDCHDRASTGSSSPFPHLVSLSPFAISPIRFLCLVLCLTSSTLADPCSNLMVLM